MLPKRTDPNFAPAVKAARKAKGWAQHELAKRAGIHVTTIGALERGEHKPQQATWILLNKILKSAVVKPQANKLNEQTLPLVVTPAMVDSLFEQTLRSIEELPAIVPVNTLANVSVKEMLDELSARGLAVQIAQIGLPKRYSIELDISDDPEVEQLTKEWAAQFDVDVELVTENGPAGGNPVFKLTGTMEKLETLALDYFDDDIDEVLGFLSNIR